MKNPNWERDEVMLALDLYFNLKPGQISANNVDITNLSNLLNRLPRFDGKPDNGSFRNPNGVSLKMSNFLAIDPSYDGKGMAAYSKLDESIFNEFKDQQDLLSEIAKSIKKAIETSDFIKVESALAKEENSFAKEGKILYRLHRYKERNVSLVNRKKQQYLKRHGNLACELCRFDFHAVYGEVGKDFAECHHKTPLYSLDVETNTHLDDLMIICSNCHRMVHRGWIPN
ncbi:HNH endonuclease [Pedobacter sp.]|uniref:HNH endonuclease n=1 Tax=Pedobacter sp. TaxID=1411316 RepID=UPI003BA9D88E